MTSGRAAESSAAGEPPGWLVATGGGIVVSADERLCALLGAPGPAALAGRSWPSLVVASQQDRAASARAAVEAGRPWRGSLGFRFGADIVNLEVDLQPVASPDGPVALLRATPVAGRTQPDDAESALDAAAPALVAVLEAVAQLPDGEPVARAVLQAIASTVDADWAVVLRFDGDAGTAVATYPSPMAGIAPGLRWTGLDEAERGLRDSGEPALEGDLVRRPADRSPLARLPAFGMRSRLAAPLYEGSTVRGCVALYSSRRFAYTTAEGILLERLARPLGDRLTEAHSAAGQPAPAAEVAPVPVPPPAPPAGPPPPGPPPTPAAPASEPSEPAPVSRAEEAPAARPADARPTDAPPADGRAAQRERLGALSELVSGVAHELNNPLTAILGYAQILPTLEGDDRQQALGTIEQEAMRASRIVRNLLYFARQHHPRVQPVDVEAVLGRVVDVRRYSLEVDNIRVTTDFAGVPSVSADEYQLEQVFLNLLTNAHQALRHTNGGLIAVSTRVADGMVEVLVTDDGPGVPDDVAARIFEPFFTAGSGEGTGLGLAIVYGIVTEHGGDVWVERAPSGGAQFVMRLPVADARPPASAGDRGSAAGPAVERQQRILVVDDEPPIRSLTKEILEAAGYQVETAASGDQALQLARSGDFDLLLSDVRMPGMGGAELYERLIDAAPEMRRRVVFITGDAEGSDAAELLRSGVRYLEKPFDTSSLLRTVREALAAR